MYILVGSELGAPRSLVQATQTRAHRCVNPLLLETECGEAFPGADPRLGQWSELSKPGRASVRMTTYVRYAAR